MWHEIRKQERKIRCMIVDYKRRAERRRDYYEKIKADPTQFLQIHGRACKVHLDPQVAAAGDSPAVMMAWQGDQDIMIDRFDVRAHLDYIAEYKGSPEESLSYDERLINYERYRILVQNDFLGVSEEKFLHQLYLEEQFGVVKNEPQPLEGKKKVPGAAIGFNYDDPLGEQAPVQAAPLPPPPEPEPEPPVEEEEEEDDSDIDFDMCVDVNKVSTQQAHELNNCGHIYGMDGNDFFSFLTKDKEEADNLRLARELEEEKAMYSGRKSRRERRAYRDKKLAGRKISPPSYASRKSPTYRDYCELSRSRSKSTSPVNSGKITYITSFSGEEQPSGSSPKPAKPSSSTYKSPSDRDDREIKYRPRTPDNRRHRYRSRSKSKSPERSYRDRRRSRSRSRERSYYRRRTRSPPSARAPRPTNQREPSSAKSKSKSPQRVVKTENKPVFNPAVPIKQPAPPIISRYYGRRGQSSSSELSLSDDDDNQSDKNSSKSSSSKKPWSDFGNAGGRNKAGPSAAVSSQPKMTPQERLKKKMQALLNKQYKADKKAEREKKEKEEQERMDREDEMREMSIKLRKRERRRRHEHMTDRRRSGSSQSGSSRSRSRSRSRSWSPAPRHRRKRRSYSRSNSRSRSPSPSPRSRERFEGPRPLVDY